jgi:hypothetical protein
LHDIRANRRWPHLPPQHFASCALCQYSLYSALVREVHRTPTTHAGERLAQKQTAFRCLPSWTPILSPAASDSCCSRCPWSAVFPRPQDTVSQSHGHGGGAQSAAAVRCGLHARNTSAQETPAMSRDILEHAGALGRVPSRTPRKRRPVRSRTCPRWRRGPWRIRQGRCRPGGAQRGRQRRSQAAHARTHTHLHVNPKHASTVAQSAAVPLPRAAHPSPRRRHFITHPGEHCFCEEPPRRERDLIGEICFERAQENRLFSGLPSNPILCASFRIVNVSDVEWGTRAGAAAQMLACARAGLAIFLPHALPWAATRRCWRAEVGVGWLCRGLYVLTVRNILQGWRMKTCAAAGRLI